MTKPYYEKREITDFKDLINQSTAIYGNKNAFWIKGIMGEYTGITYKELKKDIDAVGTEFVNMGLRHERVAVIGENCYEWCLTYLGTTNGTGTIVPLDKELPTNEVKELLLRSHAKAIVYSDDDKDIFNDIETHLNDTNNPHGINCETIGAASKDYVDNALAGISVTLESMGVTATANELNYVDGVTSNIQTQFNAVTDRLADLEAVADALAQI